MHCKTASVRPGPCGDGAARGNCFALVTYIPAPLGEFLDKLRDELVPGCGLHSHVSILPPRSLPGPADAALEQICDESTRMTPIEIEATEVAIFPGTLVVYLELGNGRDQLLAMHGQLNAQNLEYAEPYEYHPHITLAQEVEPARVPAVYELAARRWREFPWKRSFALDKLTFVQNTPENQWVDLAECRLGGLAR